MFDLTTIVLLILAEPLGVPDAVHLHLEDTARAVVVDLVCAKRATTCHRTRHLGKERLEDDLAWASLATLVDDVAASPLMDANRNEAGTMRWRLQVGARRNKPKRAPDAATELAPILEALSLDLPARPPHPAAEVSVTRFGGDPAARLDEARVHCEADAIWCSLTHLPAWAAGPRRHVRWPHIAWMGAESSPLMAADHLVLRPGEPNQLRWSWSLQIGDHQNASGPAHDLTGDHLRMLSDLVRGR